MTAPSPADDAIGLIPSTLVRGPTSRLGKDPSRRDTAPFENPPPVVSVAVYTHKSATRSCKPSSFELFLHPARANPRSARDSRSLYATSSSSADIVPFTERIPNARRPRLAGPDPRARPLTHERASDGIDPRLPPPSVARHPAASLQGRPCVAHASKPRTTFRRGFPGSAGRGLDVRRSTLDARAG